MTLRRLTSITVVPVTFLVTHALALRAIGVGADPTDYLGQLVVPFRWRALTAARATAG